MILISDSSVLIDLERGNLLEVALRAPLAMAVPDLLYDRELAEENGAVLLDLGLQVVALDAEEVAFAQKTQQQRQKLSLPDCFAVTYARRPGHMLLTGDAALRICARDIGVTCHGLLWLLDQLVALNAASPATFCAALRVIVAHPRCRLPSAEVKRRLAEWCAG